MSDVIGVLAVDDEAPARATIRRFVTSDARFRCVGEAADGLEALDAIEALAPDLIVLDVQMPRASGLDVLDALDVLGPAAPRVVFSTAYDAHAIRAFEASAVDYLLKPYDGARFARALDKAFAALTLRRLAGEHVALARELSPLASRSTLTVRGESGWISLPFDDIVRIAAAGKHVEIVLSDTLEDGRAGRTLRVRQSLADTIERLDPARFLRVHRSEVVNVAAIERLEPWTHGDGIAVLRDGSSIVVSRTHRRALLDRMRA
jgi:two-component system LytT family response regulator